MAPGYLADSTARLTSSQIKGFLAGTAASSLDGGCKYDVDNQQRIWCLWCHLLYVSTTDNFDPNVTASEGYGPKMLHPSNIM
jgi:hypothetical protein